MLHCKIYMRRTCLLQFCICIALETIKDHKLFVILKSLKFNYTGKTIKSILHFTVLKYKICVARINKSEKIA